MYEDQIKLDHTFCSVLLRKQIQNFCWAEWINVQKTITLIIIVGDAE